jgi:hypothetical protein
LTTEEKDLLYWELLLEVELVQVEQLGLLRCLARRHGLKTVFVEGLTEEGLTEYRERIAALREVQNQLTVLEKQLQAIQVILTTAQGERRTQARALEKEILGMVAQHKQPLLEVGAAGRLLASQEIEKGLPLDRTELLEKAKLVRPDGKIRLDPAAIDRRRDGHVRAVLDKGPVGLIVLGGAHDLAEQVRRHSKTCEYIRVWVRHFPSD